MFGKTRSLAGWVLAVVLFIQPLAALAQNKTLNSGGANPSGTQNGASVNITKLRLTGDDIAEVSWNVVIPAGVEVQGFDVRVDANLSNGTAQTDSKSFNGDARFGSFKFNLPLASNGGGPKPGGGSNGGGVIGPATSKNSTASGSKVIETRSSDKTPRKFGEGNISGGGNTAGNNNSGNGSGSIGVRPVRPTPTPTPRPVIPPTALPTPKPAAPKDEVHITKMVAVINAKFAAGADLAAFREFIQPTDKTTGELTPRSGRGSALQVKKLINLNQVARLATECPANQECFDIIAESREAAAALKVSMEVVFGNGVRKTATRTAGNLARPIRLSVDKVAGQQVSTVLVNINGGGNREQFIKTDTHTVALLSPSFSTKK